MSSAELRKKFLDFFKERGHTIVPSSSLIPDDPSVLLTTAGMQQFKKYYTGEADPIKDFGSKNTASVQKSFRTSDIDEVGDESHLTFFEMLGNFSFGGYFKKEAITYAHDFITKDLNLPISFVAVFEGSHDVAKDEESKEIWRSLGIKDIREQGIEDVFWGPTGSSGPCGPTTEIYCDNKAGGKAEIWNIVFNEFFYSGSREELLSGHSEKKLERLSTPGVDTGMGLERLAMIIQNVRNIFETDLFRPLVDLLPGSFDPRQSRITADHLRASAFLIADGVRPSNKGAGYILRRLLRRVVAIGQLMEAPPGIYEKILESAISAYGDFYPELTAARNYIFDEYHHEREGFLKSLENGTKKIRQIEEIDAATAFDLYQSYGIPFEAIKDVAGEKASNLDRKDFDEEFKKHQEISRAGQEKKFGGHGLILNTGELKAANEEELKIVTRLHTATHLLQAALRKVLGPEVKQMGSDITAERTRFDFSFPRKLTAEEIGAVENLVNEVISQDYSVIMEEMAYNDAVNQGALYFFKEKYPERVSVYSVVDSRGSIFSKEFCGGPHVSRTSQIGRFKITKEEAVASGIRRIRASVE